MNPVRIRTLAVVVLAGSVFALPAAGQQDFPPFEKVSEGYRKVTPPADGSAPLYTVWVRDRDGQMLAELPVGFEGQRFFVVPTVAGGTRRRGCTRSGTTRSGRMRGRCTGSSTTSGSR